MFAPGNPSNIRFVDYPHNNEVTLKKSGNSSDKGIDFSEEIFYRFMGKWIGPGGPPGLQIQWRALKKSAVGSIPMHFRQKDSKASNPGGLLIGIFSLKRGNICLALECPN